MINLVYEDTDNLLNAFDKTEVLGENMYRITTSPYGNHLRRMSTYFSQINHGERCLEFDNKKIKVNILSINDKIKGKYIIPVGVNQSPKEWIGNEFAVEENRTNFVNIFDKLNEKYLKDLREGIAFLIIDNSLEGYHDNFIFTHLWDAATVRFIHPNQIIYVTGNLNIQENLKMWCDQNRGKTPIRVIPYAHFEYDISVRKVEQLLEDINSFPTFKNQYEYKQKNEDSIKVYNFLNKKPRDHRIWFFDTLRQWDLLDDGIISMNKSNNPQDILIDFRKKDKKNIEICNTLLPKYAYDDDLNDKNFDYYMYNFNTQSSLDSWISIISETHFEDEKRNVFISEKTFKCIANNHPFMILGNKHSLTHLRNLGYKTFHDLIDESYDYLESIDRIDAIIQEIRKWVSNPTKLQHFSWMKPTIEHNSNVLKFNAMYKPPTLFFDLLKWIE
jgi:hypothetical protein